jgi:hypothetical protein
MGCGFRCSAIVMATIMVTFVTWIVLILVTVDEGQFRDGYLLFVVWIMGVTSLCWVPLMYDVVRQAPCGARAGCRGASDQVQADKAHTCIHSQESCSTGNVCLKCTEHVVSRRLSCVICCEELGDRADVTILPCKHAFHRDCIVSWFGAQNKRPTCPVCRTSTT